MRLLPTTQARIDTIVSNIRNVALIPLSGDNERLIRASILNALQGQDEATRHACAEAVLNLWKPPLFPSSETSEAYCAGHQACLNASAL